MSFNLEEHEEYMRESDIRIVEFFLKQSKILDDKIVKDGDDTKRVASLVHAERERLSIPNIQPLSKMTVLGYNPDSEWINTLKDECNVKEIILESDYSKYGSFLVRPDGKVLGKKLGSKFKDILKRAKDGESAESLGLLDGEYTQSFVFTRELPSGVYDPTSSVLVVLDVTLDDRLLLEREVRELGKAIKQRRKELECSIKEYVDVVLYGYSHLKEFEEELKTSCYVDSIEFLESESKSLEIKKKPG